MNRGRGSMEAMLDRFVFRCDHGAARRFPENETTACSSTCIGAPFRVSLDVAAPPTISRFYLEWPSGPSPEAGPTSHLVAAHRDCVLFRLTSVVKSKTSPQHLMYPDDYFLYRPGTADASSSPSLTRLPTCIRPKADAGQAGEEEEKEVERETEPESWPDYELEDLVELMKPTKEMLWVERLLRQKHEKEMALGVEVVEEVVRSSLVVENVGLVCSRDGEYVVAELQLNMSNHEVLAELCMLCGRFTDAATQWVFKRQPVTYNVHRRSSGFKGLQFFSPQAVVPAGERHLCWVDYSQGVILANVFDLEPELFVYYIPFPPVAPSGREYMHRGVCSTDGGLKFIDVVANDTIPRDNSFTIWTYKLIMMNTGMKWRMDNLRHMTAKELWGLEVPAPIPHEVPLCPLVSIDKPQVLRFLLSECTDYVDTVTLVTVNMESRTVLSVCPYIKGEQELCGDDADLAQAKSSLLQPFLPAEFSTLSRCNKKKFEA